MKTEMPTSAENIVEEKLLQVRYTNVFDRILMEIQLIHLFDNFGLGFFANLTISCQNNVDGRNYTRCIENKISVLRETSLRLFRLQHHLRLPECYTLYQRVRNQMPERDVRNYLFQETT